MHYTYVDWTLEEIPRPFYVGKGSEERVKLLHRRNPRHIAIRKAFGIRREIVFSTLDEKAALNEEVRLIAQLNTRDETGGWGANFTEGGEGVKGRKHDVETRKRISLTMKGHSKSEETRVRMRLAQAKSAITQFDLRGNIVAIHPSQSEAKRQTNISNISSCCRRKIQSAGGFVWRYEGDRFDPKLPPAVLSQEHRRKISEAHMGMKHTAETRDKISAVQRGRTLSPEHKKKIGLGVRTYHEVKNGS